MWIGGNTNDIRCVPTSCTLGMICVNGTASDGSNRILDEPRFVDGVCVNGDLHVVLVGDVETDINGSGCGAPVFV